MRHRIFHSIQLHDRLTDYAQRMNISLDETERAYQWLLDHEGLFEEPSSEGTRVSICSVDMESRIDEPQPRQLYALLKQEVPAQLVPRMGLNWPTLKDRWLRTWEQVYNIFVNKIPIHAVRIGWLRLGGAKIGKASSVWRHTEILGINNLVIGDDSVVAWHCQLDARAGLRIGNHVAIASHVLIIAGSHDLTAPEFWSVAAPIVIEDYVWIASRALIAHGAYLERGCVVTAQTLVSKRISAYKIVGGSGAKSMGERPHNLNYRVGGRGLFTLLH